MKLIVAVGFAILSILTIEVAQYQAGYLGYGLNRHFNNRSNNTIFNCTRFDKTRFNKTRFTRFARYSKFNHARVAVIVVPVAAASSRFNAAKPNVTTFGKARPYDKLIYREEIYEPAKTFKQTKKLVTLPNALKFHFKQISAINITDLLRNGKNGILSLIKGGPGQNNATVQFKSKRGWPMKFLVEFFGS